MPCRLFSWATTQATSVPASAWASAEAVRLGWPGGAASARGIRGRGRPRSVDQVIGPVGPGQLDVVPHQSPPGPVHQAGVQLLHQRDVQVGQPLLDPLVGPAETCRLLQRDRNAVDVGVAAPPQQHDRIAGRGAHVHDGARSPTRVPGGMAFWISARACDGDGLLTSRSLPQRHLPVEVNCAAGSSRQRTRRGLCRPSDAELQRPRRRSGCCATSGSATGTRSRLPCVFTLLECCRCKVPAYVTADTRMVNVPKALTSVAAVAASLRRHRSDAVGDHPA